MASVSHEPDERVRVLVPAVRVPLKVGGVRVGRGPPPPVAVMSLPPVRRGFVDIEPAPVPRKPGTVPDTVIPALLGPPIAVMVPTGMPSTVTAWPGAKPNSYHDRRSLRVIVLPARLKLPALLVCGSKTAIVPLQGETQDGTALTVSVLPATFVIMPNAWPFHIIS